MHIRGTAIIWRDFRVRLNFLGNTLVSLSFFTLAGLSLGGCSLLLDRFDQDRDVTDGGGLDSGDVDGGVGPCTHAVAADGTCCDPQPEPGSQGSCAAYFESYRWDGRDCVRVGYSGCNADPALFDDYNSCLASYRECVPAPNPCHVGGCSGQLCSDQPGAISTCEWREEYACYQDHGVCEPQPDGECGWTPTEALNKCLDGHQDPDCRTTGCESGESCEPCWSTYACLPPGVVC